MSNEDEYRTLILFLLTVLVLSLFAVTVAAARENVLTGTLAVIDSLLVSGDYEGSQRLVESLADSSSAADSLDPYRIILQKVAVALALPDSLAAPYCLAGTTYEQRFQEVHAGTKSGVCFQQYLRYLREGNHVRAYERYLVSEFLRQRHVASERARLYRNLNLTREFVKRGEFHEAEDMTRLFEKEETTNTFLLHKEDLEKLYSWLQPEIEKGLWFEGYETGRVEVDKTVSISIGWGFDPFLSIPYDNVRFVDAPNAIPTVVLTEGSISKAVAGWGGEVGIFITPSLTVGLSYHSGRASAANAFHDESRTVRKFRMLIEYKSISAWLRYYLDSRTGVRGFCDFSAGSNQRKLSPEPITGDPNAVFIVEHKETGVSVSAALGVEYVTSWSFPMVAAAYARGEFAPTNTHVFPAFAMHFGLRAGVFI